MTTSVQDHLASYIEQYVADNPKSAELIKSSSDTLPGGTTRSVLVHDPFPLCLVGGRECYVTSADGHEYLDFVSEYCAGMFGHKHPDIIAAIKGVTESGFTLGGPNPTEQDLSRLLVQRFPSVDAIRFCNSGPEANIAAIATGLAHTQRKKVMVFNGAYHGGCLTFTKANPMLMPHQFVHGVYNDWERTKAQLDHDVGVILIEPLQFAGGMVQGSAEFLGFLREQATAIGAVLIFDEVVTSRLAYGGLQETFGITPDMTTVGEHFGGGFSFGAFGGKKSIMGIYDPHSPKCIYQSGTWNNNLFSMSAGVVAAGLLSRENLERTNKVGDRIRDGVNQVFAKRIPGKAIAIVYGSIIETHFFGEQGDKLRDLFYFFLLKNRIYMGHRGFLALNITHTNEHADRFISAVDEFCKTCMPA